MNCILLNTKEKILKDVCNQAVNGKKYDFLRICRRSLKYLILYSSEEINSYRFETT